MFSYKSTVKVSGLIHELINPMKWMLVNLVMMNWKYTTLGPTS